MPRIDLKLVTIVLTFVALLVPWVALGFPRWRRARSPLWSLALLFIYAFYSAGTSGGSFRGFLVLSGYLLVSALLAIPVDSARSIFVVATALALWLPFDVNWGDHRIMSGIWRWPNDDLGYPLSSLTATVAALLYFTCARPMGLRYEWRIDRKTLLYVGALLVVLTAVMIPLGQAISFLAAAPADTWSHPLRRALAEIAVVALLIFVFTGVPEEIVFRGLIQNSLTARAVGVWQERGALVAASLIFGAAHLNNPAGIYTTPNFAYMGMASIAGLFYGLAWRRGGILAAALLHTAVDWIWRFFLTGDPARSAAELIAGAP